MYIVKMPCGGVERQFRLGDPFDPKELDYRIMRACYYEASPFYVGV